MMRILFLLFILFCGTNVLCAQSADSGKPISTHEQINDSTYRFFYDQNYFLVDKDCEFFAIERIAVFDVKKNKFDGAFTDYDLDRNTLLKGAYQDGLPSGKFTAYHYTHNIKWEVEFQKGIAVGNWNYFYPDGLPLLSMKYVDGTPVVQTMWNNRGKLTVKEGNGKFEFINPIDGYSEYGFNRYKVRGKIENGLPQGRWDISYMDDKNVELAAYERYEQGFFISGFDFFRDLPYNGPKFSLGPKDFFTRAEMMIYKACSYDIHIGYTNYLATAITEAFASGKLENFEMQEFSFDVEVNKNGTPSKVNFTKELSFKPINDAFKFFINNMDYFVPSFVDGKSIDDTLTISGLAEKQPDQPVTFYVTEISRKIEHQKTKEMD